MSCFVKGRRKHPVLRQVLLPVCMFIVILGLFTWGIDHVERTARTEQLEAARKAISRAAVQCYASEGFYPPKVDYLEEKYGLLLDHNRYIVDYQCFASNIMPDITVLPKEI